MSKLSISELWQSAKLREKLTIIIGLVYIVLPFDFIPEIILGPLGLLDDGGALLVVLYAVVSVVNRHKGSRSNIVDGHEATR